MTTISQAKLISSIFKTINLRATQEYLYCLLKKHCLSVTDLYGLHLLCLQQLPLTDLLIREYSTEPVLAFDKALQHLVTVRLIKKRLLTPNAAECDIGYCITLAKADQVGGNPGYHHCLYITDTHIQIISRYQELTETPLRHYQVLLNIDTGHCSTIAISCELPISDRPNWPITLTYQHQHFSYNENTNEITESSEYYRKLDYDLTYATSQIAQYAPTARPLSPSDLRYITMEGWTHYNDHFSALLPRQHRYTYPPLLDATAASHCAAEIAQLQLLDKLF